MGRAYGSCSSLFASDSSPMQQNGSSLRLLFFSIRIGLKSDATKWVEPTAFFLLSLQRTDVRCNKMGRAYGFCSSLFASDSSPMQQNGSSLQLLFFSLRNGLMSDATKWAKPTALVFLYSQQTDARCNKMGRAYGSHTLIMSPLSPTY
jgi:hypothetical protein